MLYLARAIGIWGNKLMPLPMMRWAKVRNRPTVCFVAKQVIRRPMVFLRALCPTNFADIRQFRRVQLLNLDAGALDGFSFRVALRSPAASNTNKWVFWVAAGIHIEPDTPTETAAVLAVVSWILDVIFPRGIDHDAVPFFLR